MVSGRDARQEIHGHHWRVEGHRYTRPPRYSREGYFRAHRWRPEYELPGQPVTSQPETRRFHKDLKPSAIPGSQTALNTHFH